MSIWDPRQRKLGREAGLNVKLSLISDPPLPDPDELHRSAKRKSLRRTPSKYRRTSAALIDFDESLQDDTLATTSKPHPSVFSPPMSSSDHEQRAGDVPTAQLLSFTPGKGISKTPRKTNSSEGAFQQMYISITPSKKMR